MSFSDFSGNNVFVPYLFIFWPHSSMGGLSFPSRDRTHAPCSGSMESYLIVCQGSPTMSLRFSFSVNLLLHCLKQAI